MRKIPHRLYFDTKYYMNIVNPTNVECHTIYMTMIMPNGQLYGQSIALSPYEVTKANFNIWRHALKTLLDAKHITIEMYDKVYGEQNETI